MDILTTSPAAAAWLEAFGARIIRYDSEPEEAPGAQLRCFLTSDEEVIEAHREEAEAVVVVLDEMSAARVAKPGAPDHVFSPRTLKDVLEMALALGRIAGRVPRAVEVVGEGERRLAIARLRRKREGRLRQTAIALTSLDPPVAEGRWVPDMIEQSGAVPVGRAAGEEALVLSVDQLRVLDPDILFVIAPHSDLASTRDRMFTLRASAEWQAVRAVANRRVLFFDGTQHFMMPGPGVFRTMLRLDALLHDLQDAY